MVVRTWALGVILVLASMVMTSPVAAGNADPLSRYRWASRLVVVLAANPADPLLEQQRRIFQSMGEAARERDLVLIEAVGADPRAQAMRDHLGVSEDVSRAVLVGKDGGAKLISAVPFTPERLIEAIDAMPMRRQERRR